MKVYEQHSTAFRHASAYVVMHGKNLIGTVAIKYPRDGAGRLYAYVHPMGVPMVRGYAGGYGYDKQTAAVYDAMRKLDPARLDGPTKYARTFRDSILTAADGLDWVNAMRKAGFNVIRAV